MCSPYRIYTHRNTGETQRSDHDVEQEPARDQHREHGHRASSSNVQELPVQCAVSSRRYVVMLIILLVMIQADRAFNRM